MQSAIKTQEESLAVHEKAMQILKDQLKDLSSDSETQQVEFTSFVKDYKRVMKER